MHLEEDTVCVYVCVYVYIYIYAKKHHFPSVFCILYPSPLPSSYSTRTSQPITSYHILIHTGSEDIK